jgi:hypothetical protein
MPGHVTSTATRGPGAAATISPAEAKFDTPNKTSRLKMTEIFFMANLLVRIYFKLQTIGRFLKAAGFIGNGWFLKNIFLRDDTFLI